jgi:DNA-binding CsgD family transcriptional regulator
MSAGVLHSSEQHTSRRRTEAVEPVGRQWELAEADRFLDAVPAGPAALVLEGEPGIGKTTIWRAAVDAARNRSYRVLVCRASESESALSFLGLGDLLDSVSDAMLEALPEPQRRGLELALLRSPGEGSPDRVAVARGTLAVLRAAASEKPTLLAIDDLQWLDAPSADVVRFVAHRLTAEPLGLLVSVREDGATTLELDHGFPGAGLFRLRLQGLTFEELEDVVGAHLPVSFTQPTWRTLYRISAGNPFFALQLAEALERRGERTFGERLPVPNTLAEAMRERLAALSPGARAALLPVAALAKPTLELVRAGAAEPTDVEEAIRTGVLQLDGDRLRFAHPLLGSLVYEDASETERQAAHSALARLVSDEEEQAVHLARGTVEADEGIAATLEAAADQAGGRGHPEVAADLAEHAARLTPDEQTDDGPRRIRKAATFVYATGDGPRSCEMLEHLIADLPPSQERARALRLLGWFVDDIPRCRAILEQALGETGDDLQLTSQALSMLAAKECWGGRWGAAALHLRTAVELAEQSGGGAPLATARARLAWVEPGPDQLTDLERAVELERSLPDSLPYLDSPSFLRGMVLLAVDRLDDARRELEESYERGLALGQLFRGVHLGFLAELELRAGNWARALDHARALDDIRRRWAGADGQAWLAGCWTMVEAHLGHVDSAIEAAERTSSLARSVGGFWMLMRSESALGLLELSAGRDAAALDHLLPLLEDRDGVSLHKSLVARTLSSAVEALIGVGELERAATIAGRLEEHARAMPVPSALAAAARCRALVLAHDGEADAARASIESALAEHARLHEPFELGRTYLVQGSIERRAKQKADAREALRRAEDIFAGLGARLWLERTRRELARTGIARSLDRELTPTERQVAELAASGAHNKEIAGALFVSVKTVEANLSRVYTKLGIRSRVELASRLARPAQHDFGRATQR